MDLSSSRYEKTLNGEPNPDYDKKARMMDIYRKLRTTSFRRPLCNAEGEFWYRSGKLHRTDGPAAIYKNGRKIWYNEGKIHRVDGPAIEYRDKRRDWYRNGNLHRNDGPAIEHPNGWNLWYQYGKLHRINGPAVEYENGVSAWYHRGRLLPEGPLRGICIAMSPLELPPYVLMWILEWSHDDIVRDLNGRSLIKMIIGIQNSRNRIMKQRSKGIPSK